MIDLCVKDIYNGFDEEARRNIQNFMQQQAAKEQEQQRQQQVQSQKQPNHTQQSLEQQKKKPELANWQKVMDNGEYLRSAEMAEEANYNMIDGLMNNMPKKKDKNAPRSSVLKRLRKHQQKIASQGKGQPQHIVLEIFRNFIRISFSGILSLCALTLCVSAYQSSSFGAVIIASICWGLPALIRIFFGGIIWIIVDSMPIFLIINVIINDIYEIWYIVLGISICFAVGCLVKGLVFYKSKQFS